MDFAAGFVSLYVAHHVADYWVQTGCQSLHKGRRDSLGRWMCVKHCIGHTVSSGMILAVTGWATSSGVSILGVLLGLGFIGVSHYWIDRRFTLKRFALCWGRLTGQGSDKLRYYLRGGAPLLDQSAHIFCLWIGSLLLTV